MQCIIIKMFYGYSRISSTFSIDGEDVRIMLWVCSNTIILFILNMNKKKEEKKNLTFTLIKDTAGQEEFDAITKAYYRGAQACVITFSTTDRNSFEAVKDWKKKVENECGEIPTVLVQNKIDLMEQSIVTL